MGLSADDRGSVLQLFEDYRAAWNDARDPKACAELYERDGDLLAADGAFLASPKEIEQYYVQVLSGAYEDFRVDDIEVISLREIGPDVAILDAKWNLIRMGIEGGQGELVARIIASLIAKKSAGAWKFSAVRVMVPTTPGS